MKVKLLRAAAGPEFSYGAGAIVDFPKDVAKELVASGQAAPVDEIAADMVEEPKKIETAEGGEDVETASTRKKGKHKGRGDAE